mgnify:FL=1
MRIWLKFIDWLGSLKSDNAKLNDEMTILRYERDVLRLANKMLREELKAARNTISVQDAQYEGAEAALKTARAEIEELQANEETNWPLVAYALRQKANRAKYDAKRRGK